VKKALVAKFSPKKKAKDLVKKAKKAKAAKISPKKAKATMKKFAPKAKAAVKKALAK